MGRIFWHRSLVVVGLLSAAMMWSVVASAATTLQNSAGCGQPSERIPPENQGTGVGKRVVGGNPITTSSFPWTVLMKRFGHSGVVCTGAILSHRFVLTAAHCFDNVHPTEVYLWVGKDDLDYPSSHQDVHFVQEVAVHGAYNRTTKLNDLALVLTVQDIFFNGNVRPVCLPESGTPPEPDCVLAGYGDTQGTGHDHGLNFIQVPLVDDALCARDDWLGTDFRAVQQASFCAGYADGGPDICSGDSGAALVCPHPDEDRYYVYGVASWGKGCGERQKPGVYTRVPLFHDWIVSLINLYLKH